MHERVGGSDPCLALLFEACGGSDGDCPAVGPCFASKGVDDQWMGIVGLHCIAVTVGVVCCCRSLDINDVSRC